MTCDVIDEVLDEESVQDTSDVDSVGLSESIADPSEEAEMRVYRVWGS